MKEIRYNIERYHSTVHLCFNWLIVIAIVVIYSLFGVFFYRKIRCSGGISQVKNNRRLLREISTFLQVLITCTLVVFTSLGFIYQQYLASIPILVFTGYICHQGSPAVIYLCMNQSIRNSIFKGDKISQYTTKGYPATRSVPSISKNDI
uniref:7TM GPCR serpentine receptor class x (Srx) domain-containing protein n=1 Tax=Ditylenchus dipsaci TaxID=166011 RepID=A0A915CXL3_9BILA